MLNIKDQENPNFSAFDACGSLSNDQVFDPGRLGKRSDGTEIPKIYSKPEVERVKNSLYGRCMQNQIDTVSDASRCSLKVARLVAFPSSKIVTSFATVATPDKGS